MKSPAADMAARLRKTKMKKGGKVKSKAMPKMAHEMPMKYRKGGKIGCK